MNVTDEQLTASIVVTLLFILVLLGAITLLLYQLKRTSSPRGRITRVGVAGVLALMVYFSFGRFVLESHLLLHPKYVSGRTIEYGSVFLKGEGIVFEYSVNGITYRNCNTFHPVPRDQIRVPGGFYLVRCADGYESEGRIDFNRPAAEE